MSAAGEDLSAAGGEAMRASAAGPPAREGPLARVVFALLVLASFAAFGAMQSLKHAPTAVQSLRMSASFTPGAAGARGIESIAFHIQRSDRVTVEVIDSQGDVVRTIARGLWLPGYRRVQLTWDGAEAGGRRAPAGTYRVRIDLARQRREVLSPVSFELLSGRGAR